MNRSVRQSSQAFIVRHDDKRLAEFVTQVEEELVQLCLILGIQRA